MSLRPIGEIIAESLPKWGRRGIRHHLGRASNTTGEDASSAFTEANTIRILMGLTWPQVFTDDNGDSENRGAA